MAVAQTTIPQQLMMDIHELVPSENNYNKHPREQIDALCDDLEEFGQQKPICIQMRDGTPTIIAGEGVWLAFHQLSKTDEAQWNNIWVTLVPEDWSQEKAEDFLVADNETRNGAVTDKEMLLELLQRRKDAGAPLLAVGYTQAMYDDLVATLRPPTLDDLTQKYGDEPDDDTFWPVIRLKVPTNTKELFDNLMMEAPHGEEHEKFLFLLEQIADALNE